MAPIWFVNFLENASVFLTKRDTLCLKVQLNLSMQLVLPVFLPTAWYLLDGNIAL